MKTNYSQLAFEIGKFYLFYSELKPIELFGFIENDFSKFEPQLFNSSGVFTRRMDGINYDSFVVYLNVNSLFGIAHHGCGFENLMSFGWRLCGEEGETISNIPFVGKILILKEEEEW